MEKAFERTVACGDFCGDTARGTIALQGMRVQALILCFRMGGTKGGGRIPEPCDS